MAPTDTDPLAWDFRDLMDTVVLVERATGNNVNAEPTYGPARQIRCRVQGTTVEVRGRDGLVRVASNKVILDGVYNVTPQDRLTMPDGTHPIILTVNQSTGGRGPMYEEILT